MHGEVPVPSFAQIAIVMSQLCRAALQFLSCRIKAGQLYSFLVFIFFRGIFFPKVILQQVMYQQTRWFFYLLFLICLAQMHHIVHLLFLFLIKPFRIAKDTVVQTISFNHRYFMWSSIHSKFQFILRSWSDTCLIGKSHGHILQFVRNKPILPAVEFHEVIESTM